MTNSQPDDINARLNDIDERLEQLGDELDLIRTIQNGMRREVRTTSQATARLERTVNQLASIARDHQVALRILERESEQKRFNIERLSTEAAQDRQLAAIDRQTFQTEIRRIWEYLRDRNGGNSPPT